MAEQSDVKRICFLVEKIKTNYTALQPGFKSIESLVGKVEVADYGSWQPDFKRIESLVANIDVVNYTTLQLRLKGIHPLIDKIEVVKYPEALQLRDQCLRETKPL